MAEYSHMWFQMGNTTSPNDTPPPPINTLLALTSLNKNSYEIFTIFYPSKGFQNWRNTDKISLKSDYFPTYQPKIRYHAINKSTY